MKKHLILSLFLLSLSLGPLDARPPMKKESVKVNNRILAKVEGKPITVIDVQKKMDMVFYKNFPEYSNIPAARHQYYSINWKHVLDDLIDKELVLADAKDSKIEISNGDIRQEMEKLFGPNVIANLQKAHMTFEEAWEILKGELTIRRMMMGKAQIKALRHITPKVVRNKYLETKEKYFHPDEWAYYVISVRNSDSDKGSLTAQVIHRLLTDGYSHEEVKRKIAEMSEVDPETKITFSDEYKQKREDISEAYLTILSQLGENQFSLPISQESRSNKSIVYRIFMVTGKIEKGYAPFKEVEPEIKAELTEAAMMQETKKYIDSLRKKFRMDEKSVSSMIPETFEPFVIQ